MDRALIEADGGPAPSSTVPADDGLAASRRSRRWRRMGVAVLSAFVLAALTQQLGMRTDTVTGTSGDLTVTITYADRGRGALAAAFKIDVVRPGGFEDEIEVRTSQGYLEIFDGNGFEPDPDATTTDGGAVVWTFDPPPGSELNIILDARIEPGVFGRERGTTTVTVGDDVVTLDYTTWVAP